MTWWTCSSGFTWERRSSSSDRSSFRRVLKIAWLPMTLWFYPRFACATLVFATLATGAAAHPHVWVETRSVIVFDEAGAMTSVRHRWTFDEMFSSYATQGLDEDGDGKLSREELQPLAQVNVESLEEYDFFTFLDAGEARGTFTDPVDYWLDWDGVQLTLNFTLPLQDALMMDARSVSLEVYDPSFFVAFDLAGTETAALENAPESCTLEVHRAEELDMATASRLAEIPAEIRDIPPELFEITSDNANAIDVTCR